VLRDSGERENVRTRNPPAAGKPENRRDAASPSPIWRPVCAPPAVALASRVPFTGMAYPLTVRGLRRRGGQPKTAPPLRKTKSQGWATQESHRIERRPPACFPDLASSNDMRRRNALEISGLLREERCPVGSTAYTISCPLSRNATPARLLLPRRSGATPG